MKQNAKICAIGETEYIMKLEVFIFRRTKILSEEKEEMVEREREERGLRKGAEGYIEINELTI